MFQSSLVPECVPATTFVLSGKPAAVVFTQSASTWESGKTVSSVCAMCAIGSFHAAFARSWSGLAFAYRPESSMRRPSN